MYVKFLSCNVKKCNIWDSEITYLHVKHLLHVNLVFCAGKHIRNFSFESLSRMSSLIWCLIWIFITSSCSFWSIWVMRVVRIEPADAVRLNEHVVTGVYISTLTGESLAL